MAEFNKGGAATGAASGAAAGTAVMPGWGTAIGAVAGGLAGGFLSGSGEKRPSWSSRNFKAQARDLKYYYKHLGRAADTYGVHRLAMLGSTATPSFGQPVGSMSTGSAFGDGLQALSQSAVQAREAYDARRSRRVRDPLEAAQFDNLAAQTDAERAKAELYRAQSRSLIHQAVTQPSRLSQASDVDQPELYSYGPALTPKGLDAQSYADNYGDLLGELYGVYRWGQHIGRTYIDPWYERLTVQPSRELDPPLLDQNMAP